MIKRDRTIWSTIDVIAPLAMLGGIAIASAGYVLAAGQSSAPVSLPPVQPPAQSHDLALVRQDVAAYANGHCIRGHEAHSAETSTEMTLYTLPCSAGSDAHPSVEVRVPLCLSSSSITARNVDAGLSFFRFASEHERQSFERNKAGYAAYARNAIADPVYILCP